MAETITKTIEGKSVTFAGIEANMVANVGKLIDSNIERNVPLAKIIEMMAKFNYKAEVGGEAVAVPANTEVVVETASVGDTLITPDPVKPVKTKKEKKAAKPVKTKKEKKPVKTKAVSGKKRGRQPNVEKQTKAFELIRNMKADGKENGDIIKAGMKMFKCTYPLFYYYLNLYKKSNKK